MSGTSCGREKTFMSEGDRIERTFKTGPIVDLDVTNIRGSIEVKSWDREEVRVTATVGGDGSRDLIEIEIDGGDGYAVAKVEAVKNAGAWMREIFRSKPPSVDLDLRCPATTQLNVRSAACTVGVENLTGSVDITQASGRVRVASLNGSFTLKSASGGLVATHLNGPVNLKSVGGELIITDSLVTSLAIQTVSGGVEVNRMAPGNDPIVLNSVSGGAKLVLDPASGYTAAIRTVTGSVNTDIRAEVAEQTRTTWKADLNGGGREIRINSISGNIDLLGADAKPESADPGPGKGDERTAVLKSLDAGNIDVSEALRRLGDAPPSDSTENQESE